MAPAFSRSQSSARDLAGSTRIRCSGRVQLADAPSAWPQNPGKPIPDTDGCFGSRSLPRAAASRSLLQDRACAGVASDICGSVWSDRGNLRVTPKSVDLLRRQTSRKAFKVVAVAELDLHLKSGLELRRLRCCRSEVRQLVHHNREIRLNDARPAKSRRLRTGCCSRHSGGSKQRRSRGDT